MTDLWTPPPEHSWTCWANSMTPVSVNHRNAGDRTPFNVFSRESGVHLLCFCREQRKRLQVVSCTASPLLRTNAPTAEHSRPDGRHGGSRRSKRMRPSIPNRDGQSRRRRPAELDLISSSTRCLRLSDPTIPHADKRQSMTDAAHV